MDMKSEILSAVGMDHPDNHMCFNPASQKAANANRMGKLQPAHLLAPRATTAETGVKDIGLNSKPSDGNPYPPIMR